MLSLASLSTVIHDLHSLTVVVADLTADIPVTSPLLYTTIRESTTSARRRRSCIQEAQLMLTNLRDAYIGQSRSPNIVPFHMLDIVSYSAIVTLSLRRGGLV